MKEALNCRLPVPGKHSILAETLFITAYALLVLFIFQPFGTYEYAHPYKLARLSGYGLLILLLYPLLKKLLGARPNASGRFLKQELLTLLFAFLLLTIAAFFYHGLVISKSLHLNHLPLFILYGSGFWLLPFAALLYHQWLKAQKPAGNHPLLKAANPRLEIKGTSQYENFYFNPDDVFYLKSNGNYVMIYFKKDGGIKHE